MLLYRAINNKDKNNLDNNKKIYCTLINSYLSLKDLESSAKTYYEKRKVKKKKIAIIDNVNTCINDNIGNALDTIVGHVGGQKLQSGTSPWISVSSDFSFVAEEYSIPQSGKYNYFRERKPIIIIEIPNNKLLKDAEEIKNIRNKNNNKDFCIDLRDGNLNNLFDNDAVLAQKYNENMSAYNVVDSFNREMVKKTNVTGFSNFADKSKEILVFAQIKKDYIKAVLSPQLVDILYACNVDIEANKYLIINNYNDLNNDLINLGDYLIGKNLIDYLKDNYSNIKGSNIEEKYNHLKQVKLQMISKIVEYINKKYNTNFEATRVLDNELLVRCYENIGNLTRVSKNDLLLIEKDNHIYTHNFKKKGYYNEQLDKVISTQEVMNEIEKNKKLVKKRK